MRLKEKVWLPMMQTIVQKKVFLAFLLPILAWVAPIQAQESPTLFSGNDADGLATMVDKHPKNVGLRLRLVLARLEQFRTTIDRAQRKRLIDDVEKDMRVIYEARPGFDYPYQVMARLEYNSGEFARCVSVIDGYAERQELTGAMRQMKANSLLRLANRKSSPEPARRTESTKFVGEWLAGQAAPPLGRTLGTLRAWMVDAEFREGILAFLKPRVQTEPKNVNLMISYASALIAMGRNESAWNVIHAAERAGLSDPRTGGRHPIVGYLQLSCFEDPSPESYSGYEHDELAALVERFPENVSLRYRLAVNLKQQGDRHKRRAGYARAMLENPKKVRSKIDPDELRTTVEKETTEAHRWYNLALPHGLRAQMENPSIETIPLMMGDLYYGLGRYEDAVAQFNRGVALVPYFADLHLGLALVHKERGDVASASEELIEVCRRRGCGADNWDSEADGSILPVPRNSHEKMLVELVEDQKSRPTIVGAFLKASKASSQNPNLAAFLSMLYYYAGDRSNAVKWMLEAERRGLCGQKGDEHTLAIFIAVRDWN